MDDSPVLSQPGGFGIRTSAQLLRTLACVERRSVRNLAGWFLAAPAYEVKYALAYALYDAVEHVTWVRARLTEMRGGNPDASVRPELVAWVDEVLQAPSEGDFLAGFYGVQQVALRDFAAAALDRADPSANANEVRLLRRLLGDWDRQLAGAQTLLPSDYAARPWSAYLRARLAAIGGVEGPAPLTAPVVPPSPGVAFQCPNTIVFDSRITKAQLVRYENRQQLPPREATVEQFKVFFNEFYAAALLASVLFDASDGAYPWEFFADFARHFWDEARHSEFGAVRLRELGVAPERVNPVLYEQTRSLPVLHRLTYLTRGLEAYFMPRKPKRFKEYEVAGDFRSQLFADQDWSDEINHVRYGSRWTEYLLQDDAREIDDIIEEVKQHLSRVRGETVTDISAPF